MARAQKRRRRIPFAVFRRRGDIVISGMGELRRSPWMGVISNIAWRFDGSHLRLVFARRPS